MQYKIVFTKTDGSRQIWTATGFRSEEGIAKPILYTMQKAMAVKADIVRQLKYTNENNTSIEGVASGTTV